MVLFSLLYAVIIIVPNSDIHRNKILNLHYNNFLYTRRLFESLPQMFWLVQPDWQHTSWINSFSMYLDPQHNRQACRPTDHKKNLPRSHGRCPYFYAHFQHLCEMCVELCSFDVIYQEPHQNGRAPLFDIQKIGMRHYEIL